MDPSIVVIFKNPTVLRTRDNFREWQPIIASCTEKLSPRLCNTCKTLHPATAWPSYHWQASGFKLHIACHQNKRTRVPRVGPRPRTQVRAQQPDYTIGHPNQQYCNFCPAAQNLNTLWPWVLGECEPKALSKKIEPFVAINPLRGL